MSFNAGNLLFLFPGLSVNRNSGILHVDEMIEQEACDEAGLCIFGRRI